ncbi:MAG: ABC transporter ATP-binding protein [Clostridia bacterium]|nr:ABC transporter ATP-binding protein [Clostridia bacterium]
MVGKLLPCIGKYKKYAILAPLMMIIEVTMEVLIPIVMANIINEGILKEDLNYCITWGLIMIAMSAFSLFGGAMCGKFTAIAGTGFAKGVRKKLFDKIQDFSFYNVDKYSTASLVTRLTTDVTNTQNAFMTIIRSFVRSPGMFVFATVMAIRINGPMSLIFAVAIPILLFSLVFLFTKAHPRFKEMLTRYDALNSDVQENLTAIRTVKSFVREEYEIEKFNECTENVRQTQFKAEKIMALNSPIMQLCMYGCMLAIYFFGARFMVIDGMKEGDILSFMTYVTQILMSLMMMAFSSIQIVISRASVARIVEVLDEKIDIDDTNADENLIPCDGSIVFDKIKFSYAKNSDNLLFDDLSLKIDSGQTVGIIGGTGSAKSSLVQLIPRLYDVCGGSVSVGGHDVREYKLKNLRDNVAMVLQKNVLFSGTIMENLRWGNENATEEEVVEAAKAAQAHDFIMSFPDGYNTDLGQGGVNVSGGQKQRLCIARALLKNPKIIILDDSTSAVDTATDAKIRSAFREKLSDITTIIIAQRISSIQDADKIIVLDDGKIDGVGTHEELLATNAIYQEVYFSQNKDKEVTA